MSPLVIFLKRKSTITFLVLLAVFLLVFFWSPAFLRSSYTFVNSPVNKVEEIKIVPVAHLETPSAVKGVYVSACAASNKKMREGLIKLAQETEINTLVIDVKDYTGTISFLSPRPELQNSGKGCQVPDLKEFLAELHQNNIYAVGRITVFQDPTLANKEPAWAVKKNSDKTKLWADNKGIHYLDPGAEGVWQYIVLLAKESYALGFDEINFDYIRFPSDGNMKDIYFPYSEATIVASPTLGKSKVMRKFFEYLHQELASTSIKLSADLFGMTTTNKDDLNIGQLLEDALANFDFVAPMVYPSHYPAGFNGWKDVNAVPYEIVQYSMSKAVERAKLASSSPLKLRPWLQDNNYPVVYTAKMVRTQIQATYDVGLTSWMLWDAANTYTREALLLE